MAISYPEGTKLEFWVVDSGKLDTCSVFYNGSLVDFISDGLRHPYALQRPPVGTTVVVAVHFGGNDGGHSAIVDVTGAAPVVLTKLGPDDGLHHSYFLTGA